METVAVSWVHTGNALKGEMRLLIVRLPIECFLLLSILVVAVKWYHSKFGV